MLIKHGRHVMRVAEHEDADGDLHILTSSSGVYLTPAEQDVLIGRLLIIQMARLRQRPDLAHDTVSASVVIGCTPALAG